MALDFDNALIELARIGWGEHSEPQQTQSNDHAETLGFASSPQPMRTHNVPCRRVQHLAPWRGDSRLTPGEAGYTFQTIPSLRTPSLAWRCPERNSRLREPRMNRMGKVLHNRQG
jgi:hypothetical protein